MDERGEMTRDRQWGTLSHAKMAFYGGEATPELSGDKGAKTTASSKPLPPIATSAYWQDLKVGNAAETGKGRESKGIDSIGEDHKGQDGHGGDDKGKDRK